MDFSFSEEQEAVSDLARQVFEGRATAERVAEVARRGDGVDRELWTALADAGLLAIAVPEEHGGSGLGLAELCLVLEQQGRRVAPVPVWPTLVLGALPLAELGTAEQQARWLPGVAAGDVVLSAALDGPAVAISDRTLTGRRLSVPALPDAAAAVVPTDGRLHLVDLAAPGVTVEPVETTDRQPAGHLVLEGAPAEPVGGPGGERWLRERALVGVCALQVGVAEAALRLAADYTSTRHQFGKPLSSFQGVALKAADAYIDTEAMRATLWQAVWQLTAGLDATQAVLVAKWWAAEAGQRVVHTTQHLHGGLGADVDYPVHRYFLWGKQLEVTLGGAGATLAELGAELAAAR